MKNCRNAAVFLWKNNRKELCGLGLSAIIYDIEQSSVFENFIDDNQTILRERVVFHDAVYNNSLCKK